MRITRIPPTISNKGAKKKRYPTPEIIEARNRLRAKYGYVGDYSGAVAEIMGVSRRKVWNIAHSIVTDPYYRKEFLKAVEQVLS